MLHLRAKEVMEIAVRIERNGVDFYDTLVASSQSAEARPVFRYMAEQERQHIVDFERLAEEVEAFQPVETYAGEQDAYLQALAETHMFREYGEGAKLAHLAKSDAEAIRAATQFEKDSILLFDLLKEIVPANEKPAIEALIGQEKEHLTKLHRLSSAVKTT